MCFRAQLMHLLLPIGTAISRTTAVRMMHGSKLSVCPRLPRQTAATTKFVRECAAPWCLSRWIHRAALSPCVQIRAQRHRRRARPSRLALHELRLSDRGYLVHEIEWSGLYATGVWVIETSDFEFRWCQSCDKVGNLESWTGAHAV